jgi:hypothetical protein
MECPSIAHTTNLYNAKPWLQAHSASRLGRTVVRGHLFLLVRGRGLTVQPARTLPGLPASPRFLRRPRLLTRV